MKKVLFALSLVICSRISAQENLPLSEPKIHTIYAEAFGQGFCYSLNYDKLVNLDKKFMNSYTLGIVYVPDFIDFGIGTYIGIPVSYNWLLGKKSHHLELGIGFTSQVVFSVYGTNRTYFYNYLNPKFGYRFQKPNGGIFCRITANAMIDLLSVRLIGQKGSRSHSISALNDVGGIDYGIFPWPGISLGYTLKK